ncbi:MAG: hypothetical protein GTO18_17425 [Anaerolineales bacterium]|nr:hypothetical protein [Anaerolineales bacterium]
MGAEEILAPQEDREPSYDRKPQSGLIVVIVLIVLLCLCVACIICAGGAYWVWWNGDYIIDQFDWSALPFLAT